MTPEQKDRLLRLARVIEENEEKFDMGSWFHDQSGTYPRLTPGLPIENCGSTACAAGWAFVLWEDEIMNLVDEKWKQWGGSRGAGMYAAGSDVADFLGIAAWVFYRSEWPAHYNWLINTCGITEARACAALIRDLVNRVLVLRPEERDPILVRWYREDVDAGT